MLFNIIFILLLILLLLSAISFWQRQKKIIALLFLAAFACFLWAFAIEPYFIITTTRQEIDLSRGMENTKEIKIALLADLHLGTNKKGGFVEKVAQKLNKEQPDLVLLGGDLIRASAKPKNVLERILNLAYLKNISQNFPVYAVPGNHEYVVDGYHKFDYYFDSTPQIKRMLEEINIDYLQNEHRVIENFCLIGVDEVWAAKADLAKAKQDCPPELPKITLVHNPDFLYDYEKELAQLDLILSGHTHGGQIRLPFIGALTSGTNKIDKKYDQGLFEIGETKLFITRGLGESFLPIRFLAPPEIAILEVKVPLDKSEYRNTKS